MHANRLRRYFQQPTQTTPAQPGVSVPSGFAPLPNSLGQGGDIQEQLYRHAYEQACQQVRAKLLDLLRSRARLLGRDGDI